MLKLSQPLDKKQCMDCKGHNIDCNWEYETFIYGIGDRSKKITIYIPVYSCRDCKCKWTDWEAADIKDNAIQDYLHKKMDR